MKKTIFIVALIGLLGSASASPVSVDVKCAQTVDASVNAKVEGVLFLARTGGGPYVAVGELAVTAGFDSYPAQEYKGTYERRVGFEYAEIGAKDPESKIGRISIHFTDTKDRSESFIDFKGGGRLPLNCSETRRR